VLDVSIKCFCYDDNFVNQMMFTMDVVNMKVVDNYIILLVLKFYDFRPTSLGVMDSTSSLSGFA
jgi:hypothetical protein